MRPKYFHKYVGGNFRIDALQAAILHVKLPHLDRWAEGRRRNAARYDALFAEAKIGDRVVLPRELLRRRHIFNQYVIRVADRDALQAHLKTQGVGTEVYYPVPMHLQECFAYLGHGEGSFPESERAAKETLAIPVHPELTEAQARFVVECVADFVRSRQHSGQACEAMMAR